MNKPVFPPKVPGVGDLHSLLALLEIAKSRDKWIADAKKVLDENQKAVRLLGAKEEIQKNLDAADRVKDKAERAMDNARAASESIMEDAEVKAAEREAALDVREATLDDRMKMSTDKLLEDRADFEATSQERTVKLNALNASLRAKAENIERREKAIDPREKRAETLMEAARVMKADAETQKARLQAAMQ